MTDLQTFAKQFVSSSRDSVYIRRQDRLVIMRPNKTHHLNATACDLLEKLYAQEEVDTARVVAEVAEDYGVAPERVADDLHRLLNTLSGLLQEDWSRAQAVRFTPFGSHEIRYPILSEIALTYRCQHKCPFCYADAPQRGRQVGEMTTDEVLGVIDRIWTEAHVPTVSFTGGEPTLRQELPQFVAYAKGLGMRTNLITNGLRCADEALAEALAEARLDSAQVSIEGGSADVHDAVTCTPGSFDKSLQGIRNMKARGIHVHTNTTICPQNMHDVERMPDLAAELGNQYFSMNMVIRTGSAAGDGNELGYTRIGEIVERVYARAQALSLKMVWYSPLPYCLFNPITLGLGSNSCAAASGLLSVAPDGQVLPCSSFEQGLGNIVREPFSAIWNRRAAKYWRNKEYLPPVCEGCDLSQLCCGACPLYWDEQHGFGELPCGNNRRPLAELKWKLKRRLIGRLKGVNVS